MTVSCGADEDGLTEAARQSGDVWSEPSKPTQLTQPVNL